MSRVETQIMDGWEFTLDQQGAKSFKSVMLPHDWAITAPMNKDMKQGAAQGYLDRWGIGWYRRSLVIAEIREDHLYKLEFDGVYENCTIWVNEKEAGGHKYGYSRFTIDITDLIVEGKNQILVKVDNTQFPADRWYSGCGIYRTVKLLELPKNHLNPYEIQVKTKVDGDNGMITISTGISTSVKAIISDSSTLITQTSDNGIIEAVIPNVKLWSPEQPHLYKLELSLLDDATIVDKYSLNIGVREIETIPGKGMYLNGQSIKIKGVCVHQDAGCLGIAVRPEIWRERLVLLKEMGCNAVRAAHHIFAAEFLDICDELGLLVYEEPFDKWNSGSYARYFHTELLKDLEVMVKRDRNHPCIFIWGVGNEVENQGQDSMIEILKTLKEHLLTLDDTRPICYAMNPHFKHESGIDATKVEDIQQFVDVADSHEIYGTKEKVERIRKIAEIVDVIGCNYQEHMYPAIHEALPDKLILGTETYQFFKGHVNQLQNFSDENPWMDVEKHDYVIGGMLWTGIDYLGESMGWPYKGWSGSLVYTNNERKPMSYLFQSYWDDKPMVYFAVMDYTLQDEGVKEHWDAPRYANHWNFPQFNKSVIPYMVATNCEEVRIKLNDKTLIVNKPETYPNRMVTGFLPYMPGTITTKGYINGKEVCSHTVKTAGPSVKLGFDMEQVQLPATKGYQKLFTVRALDQDGVPVFHESARVTFKVTGPAEIIGIDNGDLSSREPYNSNQQHMYRGCVSTVVRLTGESGRVILSAYAEGMYQGQVIINVI